MPSTTLIKALAEAGTGSRRWITDAIRNGRVEINGSVAEDFRHPVNVEVDQVSIDGSPVDLKPRKATYLLLNKPKGVLSTTRDKRGRRTVMDILPKDYRRMRLYPVGRLDKDSTGLLLLTNDGELTYRLTHPRFEHEKEYLVHIDGRLKAHEKQKLEHGIRLEDGMTHPAKVGETQSLSPFNYSITIREGRKRQVRRMLESLGHRALALKRVRMGSLSLDDLREGDMRELSAGEVRNLLSRKPDIPRGIPPRAGGTPPDS
jgi:23S rRNA pseudouridine2605 synthase